MQTLKNLVSGIASRVRGPSSARARRAALTAEVLADRKRRRKELLSVLDRMVERYDRVIEFATRSRPAKERVALTNGKRPAGKNR